MQFCFTVLCKLLGMGIFMYKKISTPLSDSIVEELQAGDRVLITGRIYAARDAAHKRMCDALARGEALPVELTDEVIYYAGPCPPKPGYVTGPFGPTTSGRMDRYTPAMLAIGLRGMIGKGERSKEVVEAMKKSKAIYFAAIGGAGALIAAKIKKMKVAAYEDLGAEALAELWVEDFPVIVATDCYGVSLYETEPKKYKDKYTELQNLR